MNFDEAQRLIRDPSVDYVDHMEAAMILAENPASTDDDLRACTALGGLPAELAQTRRDEAETNPATFARIVARQYGGASSANIELQAEISRLPVALAEVLRSSSQGMTVPQIAATLGLSSGMTRRRLSQAIEAIGGRLDEAGRMSANADPLGVGHGPLGSPSAITSMKH